MSLDDLHAQLRDALDQQLAALKQHHDQALVEVRRQAEEDGQRAAEARASQLRGEMHARMEQLVAAAAAERQALEGRLRQAHEQHLGQALAAVQADAERVRKQLDLDFQQQLEHVVSSLRRSAEMRREAEQKRAQGELDAERERAAAELAEARRQGSADLDRLTAEIERLTGELAGARQQGESELDRERKELGGQLDLARTELALAQRQSETRQAELEAAQAEAAIAREGARGELEQARTDAERLTADLTRIRAELDEHRQQSRADLQVERQKSQAELDAEREHTAGELQRLRATAESRLQTTRAEFDALRRAWNLKPLLEAARHLDDSTTLTDTLNAVVARAGSLAGRAALFVVSGDRLRAWKGAAIDDEDLRAGESSIDDADMLGRAIRSGAASTAPDLAPPAFAHLGADRPAHAVPITIGGRPIAVLYADHGQNGAEPPAGAFDMIDALARHASSVIALRTATRTLDVLRGVPAAGEGQDDEQGARRFARLLVSEIKLYNEGAVRIGRQQRDLLRRLSAEIDRARRLYEERVPMSIDSGRAYFQQELVQTLADGDPALLGTT